MSDIVASLAPWGHVDELRPSKERASAGAPASHAGACYRGTSLIRNTPPLPLSQAVVPAPHAGAFRRQATKTLLSTMLSDAPQHAAIMVPTASATASTGSSDDDDDFDVAASMRILHEHRLRVKAMTPAATPELFRSFNTRARSSEGGSFEDHGTSFMTGRYQPISTRMPPRSPEAGARRPTAPGAGGQSMSALPSRSPAAWREAGPPNHPPEAGPGKGSFGGILRRSILKQHFSPERIQRTSNGDNDVADVADVAARRAATPLFMPEDSARARENLRGGADGGADRTTIFSRASALDHLRLHAQEAIARSVQAHPIP